MHENLEYLALLEIQLLGELGVERLDRDPNSVALARDDAVIAKLTYSL